MFGTIPVSEVQPPLQSIGAFISFPLIVLTLHVANRAKPEPFRVAVVLILIFTREIRAQEKAKSEPAQQKAGQSTTKVLLDNEKVRVVETWAKPGEKNEMKARPDRVTYHFNAGTQKVHYPDGKTEVLEFKAGGVLFRKAGTNQTENIGKTETHNLVINIK